MSGDHNMNQSDPGWRKRQIALDKKAENARELGLDYNKTIMDMAREAGLHVATDVNWMPVIGLEYLEAFAALVRADERDKWMERTVILIRGEREACAKLCDDLDDDIVDGLAGWQYGEAIRARGQA